MTIVLMRHGESLTNAEIPGIKTDHVNFLTSTGVDQCRAAGIKMSKNGFKPHKVFCSPLPRAQMSMMLALGSIAESDGHAPEEIEFVEDLKEMLFHGDGIHRTEAEMKSTYGDNHLDKVWKDVDHPATPGGETQRDVYKRVSKVMEETIMPVASHSEVLVVCHYFIIKAAKAWLDGEGAEAMPDYTPINGHPYFL